MAVYTHLKKEFPDGGPVRVCTQLDNVTLNQAQQAIAADWDSKLSTMYLRHHRGCRAVDGRCACLLRDGRGRLGRPQLARGTARGCGRLRHDGGRRGGSDHVRELGQPCAGRFTTRTYANRLARGGMQTSWSRSRPTLFSAVVERSWAWTSTSAGVFREKTMVRRPRTSSSSRAALARTPSPSERRTTGVPAPAAADFGLDAFAAVRAVTTGYLQTVRNLAPDSLSESKHVFHAMLDSESFPGGVTASASKAAWPRSLTSTWRHSSCCAALVAARKKWHVTLRLFVRYGGSSHRLRLHVTSTSPMISRVPSWPTTSTMSTKCTRSTESFGCATGHSRAPRRE